MPNVTKQGSHIGSGGSPARKLLLADLATELGTSISTVSRALSGHPAINQATKQRVLQLAQKCDFQPNHMASSLRKGRSKLLGIVVPYLEGRFFPSVVQGIEMAANQAGYSIIICQSNEDVSQERRHLNVLAGAQVAGVLMSLSRSTYDYQHLTSLHGRGLPVVCFDRVAEGQGLSSVVLDDFEAGYSSTCHLISQGCHRIAHLGGPRHLNTYQNRFQGYLHALQEADLPIYKSLIIETEMRHSYALAATQQLLASPDRPDGLFAAGDYAALGAMQEAVHQGLRVPDDIAIAGFSNESFTSSTVPALTTVDQGGEDMGRAAVKVLLELIEAGKRVLKPRQVVLAPKLFVRGSSIKQVLDDVSTPEIGAAHLVTRGQAALA